MAYPDDELPAIVKIAPGASPTGDPGSFPWVDVTDRVREKTTITITDGTGNWGDRVQPGSAGLTFNNDTGDMSEHNPQGQWYGSLGRDTPLLIQMRRGQDTFTGRTVSSGLGTSDSGQVWTVSSGASSAWSVGSNVGTCSISAVNSVRRVLYDATLLDVERRFSITPPATLTGGALIWRFLARYQDTDNYYALTVELNPAGTVTCRIRRNLDSTFFTLISSDPVPALTYTAGQPVHMLASVAGVHLGVKAWVGDPITDEPAGWTAEIDDYAHTLPGLVGEDFMLAAGNSNALPYAVTLADWALDVDLFGGFVPAWVPRWQAMGTDRIVPVTAKGVLYRESPATGSPPALSPMTRSIGRLGAAGHWTLEDESDSTVAASALPNGIAAAATDVNFGADNSLPGATTGAELTATSVLTGRVPAAAATNSFIAMFFFKLAAIPAGSTTLMSVHCAGTVARWDILCDATKYTYNGYNGAGTLVTSNFVNFLGVDPNAWVGVQLTTFDNAPLGIFVLCSYYAVDAPDNIVASDSSYAGTVSTPTGFTVTGSAGTAGAIYDHILLTQQFVDISLTDNLALAANGWINETPTARMARLAAEVGMRLTILDDTLDPANSTTMGRQPTASFIDLLHECRDADGGILVERPFRLLYLTRAWIYKHRDPTMQLTAEQLSDEPEPDSADQRYRNRWVVRRSGGSSATAEAPEVAAGAIAYGDLATLSLGSDDQLRDQAWWRLHLTANRRLSWPRLSINLMKTPALIDQWLNCRPGSPIAVSNPPEDVAGQDIDLLLLGHTATLNYKGWNIDGNFSPGQPWNVATIDGDQRVAADGSALTAALALGGMSYGQASTIANGPWTVDAADMPLDVNVAGERVTASAIASAVTDVFTRTTSAGWGTADSGQVWAVGAGTAANFSTNGTTGRISLSTLNAEQHVTVDVGSADVQEIQLQCLLAVTPTGAGINWGAMLRYTDSSNYVWMDVQVGTDSSLTLRAVKRVAGTATQIATVVSGTVHSTSVARILRARVDGSNLYARVYAGTDPGVWQLSTSDASLPAGTRAGVVARLMTGNTNAGPVTWTFDNLSVVDPQTVTLSARGVNGVTKAHAAGAPVDVWSPAIVAL